MSSKATKVGHTIQEQRVNVLFQVLAIIDSEARKKTFFQRLRICNRYLFKKDFSAFLGGKDVKIQNT